MNNNLANGRPDELSYLANITEDVSEKIIEQINGLKNDIGEEKFNSLVNELKKRMSKNQNENI